MGWISSSPHGSSDLCFCRISQPESSNSPAFINCSLFIESDCTWHLHVHGHLVPSDNSVHREHPNLLNSASATTLLSELSSLHVCPGNPEQKFISIATEKRNGEFLSIKGEVVAYLDKNGSGTVRTSKCHLLIENLRCQECTKYRKNLLVQHSRILHAPAQKSKKVNYR